MKKWKTIAIIALLLWVATIAAGAFVFTRGVTSVAEDGRIELGFTKPEKEFALTEMRGLLETVRDIVVALDESDIKAVADAVEGKGVAEMMKNTPKSILAKIPLEFRQLGFAMHTAFEDIGKAAKAGADKNKITSMLGEQLGRCVACHASYKMP
jgi:ribosomal protein L12E/L44/L45/RPP1/RPP2